MRGLALQSLHIDTQVPDEPLRYRAVRPGTLDRQRAAIEKLRATSELKLVAFRMPPEVIMVVEQENTRARRSARPEEMSRGQHADAGAHDDQVVELTRIDSLRHRATIAERVCRLERSRMTATHPCQKRRVITRSVLRGYCIHGARAPAIALGGVSRQQRAAERCCAGHQRTLQKVAPGDRAMLTELATLRHDEAADLTVEARPARTNM